MSANRTVVHLVPAQPAGGAELADPGLDLAMVHAYAALCWQPFT